MKKLSGPALQVKTDDGSLQPFWRKALEDMTPQEWESLCDGCGRCCLVKLEDEDTGVIHFTNIGCTLLDAGSCRCKDYPNRSQKVADCITLTPAQVRGLGWLPPTCAYRLVDEGRELPWWHPLVSGRPESVHEAGISVRGRVAANEEDVPLENLPRHIVKWPVKVPARAKVAPAPLPAGFIKKTEKIPKNRK